MQFRSTLRSVGVFASILVLLGLAIAPGGAMSVQAQTKPTIKLIYTDPLSGPFAASGERNRQAAQLAVAMLNSAGGVLGHEIRLVTVDDACGTDQATATALQLVEAGVAAVIGHFCSHSSLLAAPVYEAVGLPMLTPDSTHPRLTEEGRPNVFRLIGRDDEQGRIAEQPAQQRELRGPGAPNMGRDAEPGHELAGDEEVEHEQEHDRRHVAHQHRVHAKAA